jgi:hypothetical protein
MVFETRLTGRVSVDGLETELGEVGESLRWIETSEPSDPAIQRGSFI